MSIALEQLVKRLVAKVETLQKEVDSLRALTAQWKAPPVYASVTQPKPDGRTTRWQKQAQAP